jgi:hypothetical protein
MAGAILCSVPVLSFGVAQIATTGTAMAAGTTTCTGTSAAGGQVITFAPPGLSDLGTASASAKSTTNASSGPLSCLTSKGKSETGTLDASKIKAKSTTTCASDTNPPSPCPAGDFVYDSASQLASGASLLFKEVKTTTWVIKGVTYTSANTASSSATAGSGPGECPSTEVGFVLTGHLTAPASMSGKSTELTACLNTDAGTNVSGSFLNDIGAELGGNNSIVITSSTEDGLSSSLVFA